MKFLYIFISFINSSPDLVNEPLSRPLPSLADRLKHGRGANFNNANTSNNTSEPISIPSVRNKVDTTPTVNFDKPKKGFSNKDQSRAGIEGVEDNQERYFGNNSGAFNNLVGAVFGGNGGGGEYPYGPGYPGGYPGMQQPQVNVFTNGVPSRPVVVGGYPAGYPGFYP